MGLLDQVLGSLAGGSAAGGSQGGGAGGPGGLGGLGGMLGGGSTQGGGAAMILSLLAALLANSGRGASASATAGGGGGLGDMLGGVLGGALGGGGGGLGGALGGALGGGASGGGGLGALLEQLNRAGLGDVASSWVSTGQNRSVSPEQLESVFGSDVFREVGGRFGVEPREAASQLSDVLPDMVDRLTPQGRLPDGDLSDIGSLLGRLAPR